MTALHKDAVKYAEGVRPDGRSWRRYYLGLQTDANGEPTAGASWLYRGGKLYSYFEWDENGKFIPGTQYQSFEAQEDLAHTLEVAAYKIADEMKQKGTFDQAAEGRLKEYVNSRGMLVRSDV